MNGVYTDLNSLVRLKHKARGFSFLPKQPIRSLLSGRHASKLRGRGLNFEEIRQYRPGDDIRSIDWKITARTGKPHTRIYTEEKDHPAILIVDQRIGMFFGSKLLMKSVVAAELASLAAWRILDTGDRVGAFIFNDSELKEVKPHRSEKTIMHILKSVVGLNNALKASSNEVAKGNRLNEVLQIASKSISHDALVIIISDMRGADDNTKKIVTNLSNHNNVLVGLVADPLEEDFPDAGKLLATDLGKQIEFDSGKPDFQAAFEREYAQRLDRGKKLLISRQIPLLKIMTDQPVYQQLVRLLGGL